MLLLYGCAEKSDSEILEVQSDEEMKSRVEAEEISFDSEIDSLDSLHQDQAVLPPQEREGYYVSPPRLDPFPSMPVLVNIEESPPPYPSDFIASEDPDENGVYSFPEVEAQFPGGIIEMKKFIASNLVYPKPDLCVQGTVYVSFIIEIDGCITHLKVMRGGIDELNEEALRLVRSMPKWIPAKNNGKVVAARVRLPIRFTLN